MQVSGIQGVGNDIAGAGQAGTAAASQIDTQQFANALQGSNSSGNVSGASGMQDALAQILPLLLQVLQNLAGGEQMGGAGDSGSGGKGGGAGGPGMMGHGDTGKTQGASAC